MPRLFPAATLLLSVGVSACLPAGAAQRAFVASYGSDANTASNCILASPCRSFAAAVTVTDPDGEVLALDSIGYGIVTLTKSMTLMAAPGAFAGISVSAGNNGVTIATPGINVTLRGLNINSQGGNNGVSMTNGTRLSIENCVISNFSIAGGNGVLVNAAASVRIVDSFIRDNDRGAYIRGGATADISASKFLGNAVAGVAVFSLANGAITSASVTDSLLARNHTGVHAFETTATALSRISVIRSTITHNTYGLRAQYAGGTATITVSESLVMGNSVGFAQEGSGATLVSCGNNTAYANGSDVGTVTTLPLR